MYFLTPFQNTCEPSLETALRAACVETPTSLPRNGSVAGSPPGSRLTGCSCWGAGAPARDSYSASPSLTVALSGTCDLNTTWLSVALAPRNSRASPYLVGWPASVPVLFAGLMSASKQPVCVTSQVAVLRR